MERPRLSILIPTLLQRKALLARLLEGLRPQLGPRVEVLTCPNAGAPIGDLRNALLARATGDYVCHIDDDDRVSDDYVAILLMALESSPDCVGFRQIRYNAEKECIGYGIYSRQNEAWKHEGGIYYRWPCHLTPVRRDLAMQVGFKPISAGEDTDFATRLRPLLTREVYVERVLYEYWRRPAGPRLTQRPKPHHNAKRRPAPANAQALHAPTIEAIA